MVSRSPSIRLNSPYGLVMTDVSLLYRTLQLKVVAEVSRVMDIFLWKITHILEFENGPGAPSSAKATIYYFSLYGKTVQLPKRQFFVLLSLIP